MAHFIAGQYRRRYSLEQKSIGTKPTFCRGTSSSCSQPGKLGNRKIVLAKLYGSCSKLNRISRFPACSARMRMQHASVWAKLSDALRLAGLPE